MWMSMMSTTYKGTHMIFCKVRGAIILYIKDIFLISIINCAVYVHLCTDNTHLICFVAILCLHPIHGVISPL